jgi:hypothetical protein
MQCIDQPLCSPETARHWTDVQRPRRAKYWPERCRRIMHGPVSIGVSAASTELRGPTVCGGRLPYGLGRKDETFAVSVSFFPLSFFLSCSAASLASETAQVCNKVESSRVESLSHLASQSSHGYSTRCIASRSSPVSVAAEGRRYSRSAQPISLSLQSTHEAA